MEALPSTEKDQDVLELVEGRGSGSIARGLRRIFRTPQNIFSLSRQYHATELPTHDPEENFEIEDLSNIPTNIPSNLGKSHASAQESFYPYPNLSSFRLGDWYWNQGVQKSQTNFKQLLNIVGDHSFQASDVRDTKWDQINRKLGSDNPNEEWLDHDAGWINSSVTISVPFHRRTAHPGPQDYIVFDFYHRSLISIIREKLENPLHSRNFHYEPYELYWKPQNIGDSERVYGELYTSPAFIDAHRELQDSPLEPECDLPRIVVALMFWSDSTHLTTFSDAKLWPLYLFFGNETKYRRCKPSCHPCSHAAYFSKV